jgi:hypothetical protein
VTGYRAPKNRLHRDLLLGWQGFILALIGEHLARIQRDVKERPPYAVEWELR